MINKNTEDDLQKIDLETSLLSKMILDIAKKIDFSHIGFFSAKNLNFRQEVRDMCEKNKCRCFGTCWTCPPYCGTLEESISKAKKYKNGILLQMTGNMEDDFDVECMQETENKLKTKLTTFIKELKKNKIECLAMSAGTCTICKKCTCPNEPCRFPEDTFISMEAYGLIVNDVCNAVNVKYNYGPRTITFNACVLF